MSGVDGSGGGGGEGTGRSKFSKVSEVLVIFWVGGEVVNLIGFVSTKLWLA